jgi:hypothetical protein
MAKQPNILFILVDEMRYPMHFPPEGRRRDVGTEQPAGARNGGHPAPAAGHPAQQEALQAYWKYVIAADLSTESQRLAHML